MDAYNPMKAPSIADWIELDEAERLDLVLAYHQQLRDKIPNLNAHAAAHVMVENQVALADETPVASVMDRLMQEGLDRHEAIHAIGSVLMGVLAEAVQGESHEDPTPTYYRELMQLTAEKWLSEEL